MKNRFIFMALLSTALASPALADSCADLGGLTLHNVDITTAATQVAGTLPPDPMSAMTGGSPRPVEAGAHCLVEGKIEDREGVNGRYGIRFQLRMPTEWNGNFLFQGGGGTDGFIAPAIGAVPSTGSTATPALQRGYAVVSMDGGHDGMNLDFTADQQSRLDLAYASIGKVTNTAKTLIRTYYNNAPDQSFFMGCSNGGREAMMAAERFPLEFDGVVAGNPGFHLSSAALGGVWDVTQWAKIAPRDAMHTALTEVELQTVADEINRQCDALDGLEDGIVAAYKQCAFDPEALRGQLSDDKLDALVAVMDGAKDSAGNAVYTGWPWDPGIAAAGWRTWKLGTAEVPALHEVLTVPSTGAVFMTPPQTVPQDPDFAALAAEVADVGGYFDADETYLSTFAQKGGKMVIFQGIADPIFSAHDIARWYEEATQDTGAGFAQLFMVPGMTHCGGGAPAFEDFDPLTILENWTAGGETPTSMPAKSPALPEREMPICAYPLTAAYTGGDVNSLSSYTCAAD
ncbi:tannase/feruloyl esterase family alpha/beta hydrolase [Donghicola sp. C2-DW-16]|uniref:Tannase/feruloyl esterase family alpha/beta hydrolase n=1 Tax=Donghicola mangrovi TaxID=2729614 RepID=A0ABX2PCC4_9RHOB|nr:tannase/feruloyl esterase family alpha/beta hydrolase [Donghicola mangrovi]NVO26684.1 tannase/feruloyl esterase family alpha/beta hydrolase [Donghicola mangrovi]